MLKKLAEQVLIAYAVKLYFYILIVFMYLKGLGDVAGIDLFGSVDNTTPPTKAAPVAAVAAPQAQNNRRRATGGASSIILG